MNEGYKEVYFHEYCKTCVNGDCSNSDEPCNECLDNPINLYSHKPVKYEYDPKRKEVDPLIGVELLNDERYRSEWIYDKSVNINDYASKYFGLGWCEYKLPTGQYVLSCTKNYGASHPNYVSMPDVKLIVTKDLINWRNGFVFTGFYVNPKNAPRRFVFDIKNNEPIYVVCNFSGYYNILTTELLENLSLKKIG
jgi:hypothetical protein